MNARKIKRRIYARMAWHFALRKRVEHWLFDLETWSHGDAFSFGPTTQFDALLDDIFKPKPQHEGIILKNPHSAIEDARYMASRIHEFDASFVANRLGETDGYKFQFHDFGARGTMTAEEAEAAGEVFGGLVPKAASGYPHAEINALVKIKAPAEDGYPYVPFYNDEPAAEAELTYTVARVKDDVVVLTTDDKAAAEEAVAKAARQKRAKLYILETEKV
jgi:hypothetical protein